ncbi:coiled-coil domain-containing protein 24 [Channa argus]|uniref:coiled-coil domain-containing protein 24 n=1 Tax=Channa argus TaxID=215402 RepID=UPI0035208FF0
MIHMESPDGNQLWRPGPSLWNLITEHVYGPELPKIRSALGHYLVDMYTEVHTEAEMWYMMWQESQQGQQQGFLLSDPPAVKELVRAEVKMLLQTLRERASEEGRDCKELLLRYNPDTVNYALSHNESCYDNCTNPGDIDSGSRPSTHCSIRSNAADEIEAVRDKLNVTDFDQVVNCLRSLLMEECEVLKKLVQHLRKIIKQNYGCKSLVKKSEPSLAELRELRGAVQMDLKLYPTSFVAFPTASSPFTVKKLRNRFRPSVGLRAADETLQALTASSAARPHPPPSPCHTNPRPPHGRPHTKTSTSAKPIHTASPSMAHGTTSAITNSSNKITTSEHMNSHFISDQIIVKKLNNCSLSSDPGNASPHHRNMTPSPISQIRTQRKTRSVYEVHLSSHHSTQNGNKCDLSPQRDCLEVKEHQHYPFTCSSSLPSL